MERIVKAQDSPEKATLENSLQHYQLLCPAVFPFLFLSLVCLLSLSSCQITTHMTCFTAIDYLVQFGKQSNTGGGLSHFISFISLSVF